MKLGVRGRNVIQTIRSSTMRSAVWLILLLWVVLTAFPFVYMIGGALKDRRDSLNSGQLFSSHITLSALANVWGALHFTTYFFNSILVTSASIALSLLLFAPAAYGLAILRFPGRRFLYGLFVAILFVPSIMTLLPLVILETRFGLINTRLGLILHSPTRSRPTPFFSSV